MNPVIDFETSDEQAAFEAESSKPTTGDRVQDVKDIWFAARDYFTQDRAESITESGLQDGYFDERRAQIRLQILPYGLSPEKRSEIEAWVFGE